MGSCLRALMNLSVANRCRISDLRHAFFTNTTLEDAQVLLLIGSMMFFKWL